MDEPSPMSAIKMAGVLLSLLALGACAPAMKDYAPPSAVPGQFSTSGEAQLPDKWWTAFEDPVLDDLIARALSGNLSLRGTWARLSQARATARKQGASLFPTLDANGSAKGTRQRSRAAANDPKAWEINSASQFSFGLDGSYELDLWGRISSAADAATLDARADAEDLRTAALTLSAEVARPGTYWWNATVRSIFWRGSFAPTSRSWN